MYEVSEGWGPLCAFLGVPVPDGEAFPRLNDANEFRARIRRGLMIARTIAAAVVLTLALLVAWLVRVFLV